MLMDLLVFLSSVWDTIISFVWYIGTVLWSYLEAFLAFITEWVIRIVFYVMLKLAGFFGDVVLKILNDELSKLALNNMPDIAALVSGIPTSLKYVFGAIGLSQGVQILLGALVLRITINIIQSVLFIRFLSR